jgi:hypothetical protein
MVVSREIIAFLTESCGTDFVVLRIASKPSKRVAAREASMRRVIVGMIMGTR